jgi:hypothetical protein
VQKEEFRVASTKELMDAGVGFHVPLPTETAGRRLVSMLYRPPASPSYDPYGDVMLIYSDQMRLSTMPVPKDKQSETTQDAMAASGFLDTIVGVPAVVREAAGRADLSGSPHEPAVVAWIYRATEWQLYGEYMRTRDLARVAESMIRQQAK